MAMAAPPRVSVDRDALCYGIVLAMGALGLLSLMQGVVDVALPMSRNQPPFGFTFALTRMVGPEMLFLSILVHNFGLASLVPGVGFLAAMLEPNARYRLWIPRILFAALLVSMATAFTYMFLGSGSFNLRWSLPLFLAEATAVMAVALIAYEQFPRFKARAPDRAGVARAFEAVSLTVFAAAISLIALSVMETLIILGA